MKIFALIVLILINSIAIADSRIATAEISFEGNAIGGELIIVQVLNPNPVYFSIETIPGESAESVVKRLDAKAREIFRWEENSDAIATNNKKLSILPGWIGDYAVAGTETGLGIPKPPMSLTCSHFPDEKQLKVYWENSQVYDYIILTLHWNTNTMQASTKLPGGTTEHVVDLNQLDVNTEDVVVKVSGIVNSIPSNVSYIHLNGNLQHEICGYPGFRGLLPNWTSWVSGEDGSKLDYQCAINEKLVAQTRKTKRRIRKPKDKPFIQTIETSSSNIIGGTKRKFIGLEPGNYRVTVSSAVMVKPNGISWHFSVNAAAIKSDQANLPETGLKEIIDYENEKTEEEKYEDHSVDVTLGDGKDAIVCWTKCAGPDLVTSLRYIKLEKLD